MYKETLDVIEFDKWNKKILNVFYFVIVLAFITEMIIFFIVTYQKGYVDFQYLKLYVIRPVLLNLTVIFLTHVIHVSIKNKFKEGVKYLIIISSTLLVINTVYVHYGVSVIYGLFIFPIFLSAFYGSKKLTCFTMVLNLISYLAFVFLYLPIRPEESYYHTFYDFYTTIAIILATFIIVLSYIDREEEIMISLIKIHQSKQELAIKNFVMEFNSKIEPTTGLYNHKTFYEYLESLIEQSENYGFSLSLAVLDIDNFKRINDTYGHSLGDEVIKALAEIIKNCIDTDDYAVRYGGEEFAIIFIDKTKEMAFEIAEKIRRTFNGIIINDMDNEKFSISIGVSEHIKGMNKQRFFTDADTALYRVKKSGKNRTIMYNDESQRAAKQYKIG